LAVRQISENVGCTETILHMWITLVSTQEKRAQIMMEQEKQEKERKKERMNE